MKKLVIEISEEDIEEAVMKYNLIGEANETFGLRLTTAIAKGELLENVIKNLNQELATWKALCGGK